MPTYNENDCLKRFVAQCTADKDHLEYIINKYRLQAIFCGDRLKESNTWGFLARPHNADDEFLDFIDGNGFIVTRSAPDSHVYHITPIRTYRGLRAKTMIVDDPPAYEWE
jgi:hypothetical protein